MYLFDQVPRESVISGELQTDLSVNVRGGFAATAHDKRELQTVGRSDLHRLSLNVTDTRARTGLTRETGSTWTKGRCFYANIGLTKFKTFIEIIQVTMLIPNDVNYTGCV